MNDGNQPEHPDRRAAILMFAIGLLLPATTATGAVVPIPAKGASSRVDAIRQRGVLRVAVLDEYPWLKQNHGQTGEPFQGAAWVLAKEYARRLGVRLQTVPVDFDAKITILARDGADITIAPLLVTPARRAQVDIVSYSVSAQCLFGRADNPKVARATRIDDLDRPDVTVAYNVGSPQGSWILNRVPRAKRLSVRGNLANVPVDAIMSGRADVTTIDKYFFKGLSSTLAILLVSQVIVNQWFATRTCPLGGLLAGWMPPSRPVETLERRGERSKISNLLELSDLENGQSRA